MSEPIVTIQDMRADAELRILAAYTDGTANAREQAILALNDGNTLAVPVPGMTGQLTEILGRQGAAEFLENAGPLDSTTIVQQIRSDPRFAEVVQDAVAAAVKREGFLPEGGSHQSQANDVPIQGWQPESNLGVAQPPAPGIDAPMLHRT